MGVSTNVGTTMFLVEAWERRIAKGAKGARWCRDKKIGLIRRALKMPSDARPAAVIICNRVIDPAAEYREARELLAFHCRACGACEMRDEPP